MWNNFCEMILLCVGFKRYKILLMLLVIKEIKKFIAQTGSQAQSGFRK